MSYKYDLTSDRIAAALALAKLAPGIRHPSSVVQVGDRVLAYGTDQGKEVGKYGVGSLDLKWRRIDQLPPAAQSVVGAMVTHAIARAQGLAPVEKSYVTPAEAQLPAKNRLMGRHVKPTSEDEVHPGEEEYVLDGKLVTAAEFARAMAHRKVLPPIKKGGWKKEPREEGGDLTTRSEAFHKIARDRAGEEAYRAKHDRTPEHAQRALEKEARPSRIHGMVQQAVDRWKTADHSVHTGPEGAVAIGHLRNAHQHLEAGDIDRAHQQLTRFHYVMDQARSRMGSHLVNPRGDWVLKALDEPERIRAAAVRHPKTGKIATGPTHAHAMEKLYRKPLHELPDRVFDAHASGEHEGFLTSRGRFVGRDEAYHIAVQSGAFHGDPEWGDNLLAEDVDMHKSTDQPERIRAAFIKVPTTGQIYEGPSHGHAVVAAMDDGHSETDAEAAYHKSYQTRDAKGFPQTRNDHVGFVTSHGRYLTRQEAADFVRNNQSQHRLTTQGAWEVGKLNMQSLLHTHLDLHSPEKKDPTVSKAFTSATDFLKGW